MAETHPDAAGEVTGNGSPVRAIAVAISLGLAGPILAIILSIPAGLALQQIQPPIEVAILVSLIVWQYFAFGGISAAYLRHRGMDLEAARQYLSVRLPSVKDLLVVLGGWVLIFGMVLATLILVVQILGAEPAQNRTGQLVVDLPRLIPVLIVGMFLIVGPCEELLYRGVIQGRLRESLGPIPAIVIASAIFASVHVVALVGSLSAMLITVSILFFPSLVFGAVYEYTDNLTVSALLHGLHNSVLLALVWISLRFAPDQTASLFVL